MKKFLALLLSLLLVFGLLAGCGAEGTVEESSEESKEESKEEINTDGAMIAVCMGSINHPVHRIVQVSFFQRSQELGYMGILSGLDEGSLQELITKWESAITNGAIGCLIWTGDDSVYEFMRTYANDCKFVVPHFAHDYEDTKEFISRNITCLAAKYGKEAADFVMGELEKKGITSGTLAITQSGANITENACADAFRSEVVNSGSAFTIADVVYEGLEITEATNKCTAIITSTPDIVGAFGTTGGSCQSWAAAMQGTGKTDIVVCGVDYVEKNIELVENGSIAGLVAQPLYIEAQESVNSLDAIFHGTDFTASADEWFLELDAPVAYVGGEGDSDIASYKPIIDMVKDYFEE